MTYRTRSVIRTAIGRSCYAYKRHIKEKFRYVGHACPSAVPYKLYVTLQDEPYGSYPGVVIYLTFDTIKHNGMVY